MKFKNNHYLIARTPVYVSTTDWESTSYCGPLGRYVYGNGAFYISTEQAYDALCVFDITVTSLRNLSKLASLVHRACLLFPLLLLKWPCFIFDASAVPLKTRHSGEMGSSYFPWTRLLTITVILCVRFIVYTQYMFTTIDGAKQQPAIFYIGFSFSLFYQYFQRNFCDDYYSLVTKTRFCHQNPIFSKIWLEKGE